MPNNSQDWTERFKGQSGYVIDGVWLPRVTEIIKIKAKPGLLRYYGNLESFNQGETIKTLAASEGRLMHKTIEEILLGQEPEIPPLIQPAVTAFRNWRREHDARIHPTGVERRSVSRTHRYAGTIDMVAEIDGRHGILDLKTSSGMWRDYNLQTAAYMQAYNEERAESRPSETRWILRIDQIQDCELCGAIRRNKGGREKIWGGLGDCQHHWGPVRADLEFQELKDFERDFEAFLAAKTLWEWDNEEILREIGYL